ncbi:MoaD/ThiS family protein [uncultured Amnibacterium sp.]|uniref:MoaD/ThiS family protein n=1 Tax=uncultured Amnibacterium sp. TaxID=1631851 RepID=UPI0035C957F7
MAEPIDVTVRYFAAAAEAAGREQEVLQVAPTAGALRAELTARYGPAMAHVLQIGSLLVDGVVTRDPDRPVRARVDVLPPFAGG